MRKLTNESDMDHQRKEIRAMALQAAATWSSSRSSTGWNTVMECARDFELYIEEGRIAEVDDQ